MTGNAKFCNRCGSPMDATPQPQVYQQPVPPPQAYQPQAPVNYAPAGALRYEVFGDNMPAVSIRLNPGESIFTQSGGMVWMDNGISMTTNMQGGLMKGLGRMFSGESLFMATYTSSMPNQEIVIASTFPGHIVSIDVSGRGIIAQRGAFLCAQPSVTLSAHVVRGLGAGLFGGEGFVLQRILGNRAGLPWRSTAAWKERVLAPRGHHQSRHRNVAAYEETVQYQAQDGQGFKNVLFGGEGLIPATRNRSPAKSGCRRMTMPGFAKQLIPFLPKSSHYKGTVVSCRYVFFLIQKPLHLPAARVIGVDRTRAGIGTLGEKNTARNPYVLFG
jgi:uncharacterized protein (AIM24 family)